MDLFGHGPSSGILPCRQLWEVGGGVAGDTEICLQLFLSFPLLLQRDFATKQEELEHLRNKRTTRLHIPLPTILHLPAALCSYDPSTPTRRCKSNRRSLRASKRSG